jgi:protein TonB
MIRIIFAIILSVAIAFGLFGIMNYLTSAKETNIKQTKEIQINNFIRVQKEIQEEKKIRKIPKEPKKEPPPPNKPKVNIQKNEIEVKNLTPKIDTPKLDFKLDLSSNALSGVSVAKAITEFQNEIAIDLVPIFKIPPRYPHRARMLKKQGYVKLQFTIDTNGLVKNIQVIESKPKGFFENSAKQSLSSWKFKPKIQEGKAVEQKAIQTIEFRLTK